MFRESFSFFLTETKINKTTKHKLFCLEDICGYIGFNWKMLEYFFKITTLLNWIELNLAHPGYHGVFEPLNSSVCVSGGHHILHHPGLPHRSAPTGYHLLFYSEVLPGGIQVGSPVAGQCIISVWFVMAVRILIWA